MSRTGTTTDQPFSDDASLLHFLQATASLTGDAFLRAATEISAVMLGVDRVYVSELLLSPDRAGVVACSSRGQRTGQLEGIEYSLTGTAARVALDEGKVSIPRSAGRLFPTGDLLTEAGSEAFVAVSLRSSSGDPIGLLGLVHSQPLEDATRIAGFLEAICPRVASELERMQQAEALARSEAQFRAWADCSQDVLYIVLPAGPSAGDYCSYYFSPAVKDLTGYPPEAFLASPRLWLTLIREKGERASVKAAMETGSGGTVMTNLTTRQGEARRVEIQSRPCEDAQGHVLRIFGTIQDKTAEVARSDSLHQMERKYSGLLEDVQGTFVRLNSEGSILAFMSSDTRENSELDLEIIGHNIREIVPSGLADSLSRLRHQAMESDKLLSSELRTNNGDGYHALEANVVPIARSEVLLILRDVSANGHPGRHLKPSRQAAPRATDAYMLTDREFAILELLVDGQSDRRIADALGLSTYTVNKHVGNILGKMNATSRTAASVQALRSGLIH